MKKTTLFLVFGLASSIILASCGGSNSASDKGDSATTANASADASATATYDLTSNGIPLAISGPAGAEIKKGMMSGTIEGSKVLNWEIKKDKFRLDVTMLDQKNEDKLADILNSSKESDKESEGFAIVREEAQGYIYKKKSADGTDYNFFYVILKNDREIEFCSGLNMSDYTLEEVEVMFKAAKEAK